MALDDKTWRIDEYGRPEVRLECRLLFEYGRWRLSLSPHQRVEIDVDKALEIAGAVDESWVEGVRWAVDTNLEHEQTRLAKASEQFPKDVAQATQRFLDQQLKVAAAETDAGKVPR